MPLNWNVSIKAQPSNPANWLVAAIYDATADLVVVDFIPLPKPYGDTKNITFMNLDTVVYDFKLFESPTATPSGVALNTFSFQPSLGTITTIREDLDIMADVSPDFTSGQTLYQDDSLTGWIFDIERVGIGTMQKNVDYRLTLDGVPEDSTAANGWELINPGDVFGPQERFVHHFQPQVKSSSTGSGGGSTGNVIGGAVILDSDITLDNTYMKKACLLQGESDHFTVTLPPLNTVGEFQMITFISEGGNHINATVKANGTDAIKYLGGNQAEMTLGKSEQFSLFKANGFWNVIFPEGNFKTVGEIVYNYSQQELNTIFANGVPVSRTAYARLWKHVQTLGAALVNDSQWNVTQVVNGRTVYVNRGKFTTGDGSTTFRPPMIYAVGNLKVVDGTSRFAGSFEADQVGQVSFTLKKGNGYTGGGQNAGWFAPGDPNHPHPVENISVNAGKENIQSNSGIYALIRI